MKFRLLNGPSRQRRWTTTTTKRLVISSIRSTNASLRMSSKKRSNYFSAPTFYIPDYDLSTCHVRELPVTNMLALIMPLPDTSHFQMLPPFGKRQSHTWALLHGTSLHTSQQILLEGKIRPANWSYLRNLQRCDLPTFGAFYLGREVSNSDKTISQTGRRESYSMLSKRKEKDSKISSSGRCIEDQPTTPHTKLEAMSWCSSVWWKKESSPRLRSTRLPTATMWD